MSIDLGNLKTQIQGILNAANTTTASRDLSSGLGTRVQRVLKVNPGLIPIQPSFYPAVTVFINSKDVEDRTIANSQLVGKRKAVVTVSLAGIVWNSISTNINEDTADNDAEILMENVEEILRSNTTLAGVATWSAPTKVTYHDLKPEEEAHMRAGILNLEASIWY